MHGIGSASLQVRASFREFLRLHMQLPRRTPISTPRMRTVVGAGRRPRAGGEDSEFEDDLATCTREVTHRASIMAMYPYCVHTVKLYYPD